MSIKQSFSWRKASQSLEPGFWGIKKSYICLLTFWKLGLDRGSNDKICFKSRWISERDIFGTRASTLTKALKDFEAVVFSVAVHCVWTTQAKSCFAVVLPEGTFREMHAAYQCVSYIIYMRLPEDRSLFPQSYLHGLKDAHFSSFVLVFAVVYPAKAECPLYPDTPETQEAGLAPKQAEAVTWGFVREPGYVEMWMSLFWRFHEIWYLQDATWWCVYIYTRIYIMT